MREIGYFDEKTARRVRTVAVDGAIRLYTYTIDPADPHHLTVSEVYSDDQSSPIETRVYEYFEEPAGQGYRRLVKKIETEGEHVTLSEYNEAGLKVRFERPGESWRITYDDQWRPVRKESAGGAVALAEYDPVTGKVSRLAREHPEYPAARYEVLYRYDADGQLIEVEKSGERIEVGYHPDGSIRNIRSGADSLEFLYNSLGKPQQITAPGIGTMRVLYDAAGEIDKVENEYGAELALAITRTTGRLSAMVAEAEAVRP
jgi:hypothetical protein